MVARGNQWLPKTNGNGFLKFKDYEPPIICKRCQNIPQTLITLLSPTKSMVAGDNQWYPRTNIDVHLKFQNYQPPIMGIRPQNQSQTF